MKLPTFRWVTTYCLASIVLLVGVTTTSEATLITGNSSSSTTISPYLLTHRTGIEITSILTVDDGVEIPRTGGGTIRMVGTPDGIGAIDGSELSPAEPDYFYLLVNHEIPSTKGIVRAHGSTGSFVDHWKIDKATLEVVEGDDLIKRVYAYNGTDFYQLPTSETAFDRFCSGDRPMPTALYNSATGNGTQEILYFNGEETSNGRPLAHVVTGADAGSTYVLQSLGFANIENILLSPYEQDTTVVAIDDDAPNGEVYFYVGTKQSTGNAVQKAGLFGGKLYSLAVPGKPYEADNVLDKAISTHETFALKLIGEPGNYPMNSAEMKARGEDTTTPLDPTQTFESLKMAGPEDGAWDTRPGHENTFYFNTKGTPMSGSTSNGLSRPPKLYKLEFFNISDPSLGGNLTLLGDNLWRLGSLDNMAFDTWNGRPKLLLDEDLGGDPTMGKIWEYDLDSGNYTELCEFDAEIFKVGGSKFLTENEESSGIVSLRHIFGEGYYAFAAQVHTGMGLSAPDEMVEHGQLLIMRVNNPSGDVNRQRIIPYGSGGWDYLVTGVAPSSDWNQVGYTVSSPWDTTTNGTATGAVSTPIGYGEAAGVFALDVGQPAEPRPATYYFRRQFDLESTDNVVLFDVYMQIDDGAIVYINGVEVARYNMDYDVADSNTLFAATNEAAERNWKRIMVSRCSDLQLQSTGNVIAVTIHQENGSSSDIAMELELQAWYASADGGSAPATPTGLNCTSEDYNQLTFTWDAQSDAKIFRLERQKEGDVGWATIPFPFTPGVFTSYVDNDVEGGASYNYRMAAINVHGQSACSTVLTGCVVKKIETPVQFEETFSEANSFGQFTRVSVMDAGVGWAWDSHKDPSGAAQANGYAGTGPTEDWLITTHPINFNFFTKQLLRYDAAQEFSGPYPQVLYSSDYDPSTNNDPTSANWNLILNDTNTDSSLTAQGPYDLTSYNKLGYVAWKYTSSGGGGGQSTRYTIDNVEILAFCGYDFEGGENTDIANDSSTPWTVVNLGSTLGWIYDSYVGQQGAVNNNYGSSSGGLNGGTAANDYLISPAFASYNNNALIEFDYYEKYGDVSGVRPLSVYVTDNWTGDVTTTTWTDITPDGLDGSTSDAWVSVHSKTFSLMGNNLHVAFQYVSSGTGSGTTKRIGVDKVCPSSVKGDLVASFSHTDNGGIVKFLASVSGGVPPYSFTWDFGHGGSSNETTPQFKFTSAGEYNVTLTVMDSSANSATSSKSLIFTQYDEIPTFASDLRIATFNTYLNRPSSGALASELTSTDSVQVQRVAETIQRVQPDILFINEFDQVWATNDEFDLNTTLQSIENFKLNYLEQPQASGLSPAVFDYVFVAPCNTGVQSGFDFNNNGQTGDSDDAYGFGDFPGQYAMILLSKYPIKTDEVRTFQKFLWKDMPNAYLPPDPLDSDNDGNTTSYYNSSELEIYRLSSKSHWDVPISVGNTTIHILGSHPTPPVFDDGMATTYPDPNLIDWNGLRNHDEIRFWADYMNPNASSYIYDDVEGPSNPSGGLDKCARFVLVGDMNCDPIDGDGTLDPIGQVLRSGLAEITPVPTSQGAPEYITTGSNLDTKTADFGLRADYVLPSVNGFVIKEARVVWPQATDIEAYIVGAPPKGASDHRMVFIDVDLTQSSHSDCPKLPKETDATSPTQSPGSSAISLLVKMNGILGLISLSVAWFSW